MLSKEQISKAVDLPYRDIDVPEWGGIVRISTMTALERDGFEASIYDTDPNGKIVLNRKNFRAKLVARVLVDENGNRLFSDKEIEDLGKKSAKVLGKLFDVAQELNGLSPAEMDKIEKK